MTAKERSIDTDAPHPAHRPGWWKDCVAIASARRVCPWWRHALLAVPVAFLPSFGLRGLAEAFAWAFGLDLDALVISRRLNLGFILSAVLLAPLVETLLLALLLRIVGLGRWSSRTTLVLNAVVWGAFHVPGVGFFAFFAVAWTFYVYGASYLHGARYRFVTPLLSARLRMRCSMRSLSRARRWRCTWVKRADCSRPCRLADASAGGCESALR